MLYSKQLRSEKVVMHELTIKEQKSCNSLTVRTGLRGGMGLGDRIAGFTHATKLDRLADLYTQVTGKDCGCSSRQAYLNEVFPNF
mgnify:CR=1 FL=1